MSKSLKLVCKSDVCVKKTTCSIHNKFAAKNSRTKFIDDSKCISNNFENYKVK